MTKTPNHSFDVATILGLGTPNADPLPEAQKGEIVLRFPEGISLQSLRDSNVGKALLRQQDWYDKYDWASSPLPANTYSLRVPIPESNSKNFTEQQRLLLQAEEIAPVTLVALALLCFHKQNLPDPLKNGWIRCQEIAGDDRIELAWSDGRLAVYDGWVDDRDDYVWAAGARTS